MKKIITLGIFVLAIPLVACFAQNNETLTISTYYPSPYGAYKTVRLVPANALVPDMECANEGETSYYANTQQPYICKGSPPRWKKLGSVMKVQTGFASPSMCVGGIYDAALELCSATFYEDIVFPEAYGSIPDVIVLPVAIPDPAHAAPCSHSETDMFISYPQVSSISPTGFRLYASGSPKNGLGAAGCGASRENYMMRARVKWLAIGE